jgi:hypothetical protein
VKLLWKATWNLLKELPCDPGIYQKECIPEYNRDTCTSMFTAALFTIPSFGNSPDAARLMNRLIKFLKCGKSTQWSFIQP